jgi:hypothetical protein
MAKPDWRHAEDYCFTETLNAGQWAWEFLRRNPDYQRDWQWFNQTWQALEARYGKPPERDFQAWKRDPEAYRVVDDASGDCRVDEDKVLIECWMGAKWGYYKFPLNPAIDRPRIGEQLSWREVEDCVPLVDTTDSPYLDTDSQRIALGFDLDLPLRRQLEAAKHFLQRRQARLRRSGEVVLRTVAACRSHWTLMLRLLDGAQSGEVPASMHTELLPDTEQLDDLIELLAAANALVQGGYRNLPLLPEGVKAG